MSEPRRSEIWFANFSPTTGREQRGDRPALILSADRLNSSLAKLVIAVPLTTTERGISWHVQVSAEGLPETSYALCGQMRAISKERLRRKVGAAQQPVMREVEDRLRILLELR